ncbi:putative E3 ubiquitin-protein ligase MARCHF10 [Mixophyes fleayi]|uniref:putative E3 ubiquitin-protein ligase MARCHF10 n=1 Tax=Mixophyes fleayi TaxID=3061075 RepID=UPI003F4E15D3
MEKNWDRYKSIVNGHHMRDMQHKMDSEYQSHLHQQERIRERQAASQRIPHPLPTFYSSRSYSKPWQNGMTTKTQVLGGTGRDDGQNKQQQYISTVSKLPAIEKDKVPIRKKTASTPRISHQPQTSITVVSQPRITVEKRRVHLRRPSAKLGLTYGGESTGRGNVHKSQSKAMEPKVEHQKQIFQEKGTSHRVHNGTSSTQHSRSEENFTKCNTNYGRILTPASSLMQESREQTQFIQRPASSTISPLQTSDYVFNGQPMINIKDTTEGDEGANSLDAVYEVSVSDYTRQLPLVMRTQSYDTPPDQSHPVESSFTDSGADESRDSENEEHPSIPRQGQEVNSEIWGSTLNGVDTITRNNFFSGRPNPAPVLTSPRRWQGTGPTVPQEVDHFPAAFSNLRDMIELERISATITAPPYLELNRAPVSVVLERTLPQIQVINANNVNMQSEEYHTVPQTTTRDSVVRERDILSSEPSSVPYVAPLGLSLSSTVPNITILHENLDLVFHTLSMQRQSARRNLENIVSTVQNKEVVKQADPEKLKKLQESLLEEDFEEEGDLCRICLMGRETVENHFIAPCHCTGSMKYVHTECMKKWLIAKIKSGAELSAVRTCEMCKQKVECDIEGFNLPEQYRKHQETKATLNPSLYLVLLLHLYQQRYEELVRLSNTRDRVSEISRRFSHPSSQNSEDSRDNNQDF